jgi:hypothetical protein
LSSEHAAYYVAAKNLCYAFKEIIVEHIPREKNLASNELAQIASRIQIHDDQIERIIKVQKRILPSVITRGMDLEVNNKEIKEDDWRKPLIDYLSNPSPRVNKKVRH